MRDMIASSLNFWSSQHSNHKKRSSLVIRVVGRISLDVLKHQVSPSHNMYSISNFSHLREWSSKIILKDNFKMFGVS